LKDPTVKSTCGSNIASLLLFCFSIRFTFCSIAAHPAMSQCYTVNCVRTSDTSLSRPRGASLRTTSPVHSATTSVRQESSSRMSKQHHETKSPDTQRNSFDALPRHCSFELPADVKIIRSKNSLKQGNSKNICCSLCSERNMKWE